MGPLHGMTRWLFAPKTTIRPVGCAAVVMMMVDESNVKLIHGFKTFGTKYLFSPLTSLMYEIE